MSLRTSVRSGSAGREVRRLRVGLIAIVLGLLGSCASTDPTKSLDWWNENPPLPDIDTSSSPDGIVSVPNEAHAALRAVFDKYTCLVAPSGRPIHILAQPGVSNECMIRAREMMRFFLTPEPGTRFGSNKDEVADQMADRGATLAIFETYEDSLRAQSGTLPTIPLFYQDLYAAENVAEGSAAYIDNARRDTVPEAVFRLVHGAGIRFALPEYQAEIEGAAHKAIRDGRWKTNLDWVLEGSTAHQYATNLLEIYYGIWAHDPNETGRSFGGDFAFIDRDGLEVGDLLGVDALEMFLPGSYAYDCRLAPEFEGVFAMVETTGSPYTLKSRYLRDVRLSGANDSGLLGNAFDNRLGGNRGDNWIDGGPGNDAVLFEGPRADYLVKQTESGVSVSDSVEGRDGQDILTDVECLHFADGPMLLSGECSHDREPVLAGRANSAETDRPWGRYLLNWEEHIDSVIDELLACFDRDGDQRLSAGETTEKFLSLVRLSDLDRDGFGSRSELALALKKVLTGEVELSLSPSREVERFFSRFDLDSDGRVLPYELPASMRDGFGVADANGDGAITPDELLPSFQSGN